MTYTALIFARGGSKGIKNKNIAPVAGKPLIAHAIACALESDSVSRVVVSTDDPKIAETVKNFGADVLERPAELAGDKSPEIDAWRHAIESLPDVFQNEKSLFISLPATSPLRAPEDVDAGVQRFLKGDCDIVFGISPAHRNPYFNMVSIDKDGFLHVAIEGSDAVRRQDVPEMFDITTCVYVTSAGYVNKCKKLMEGRVGYITIPPERALDIDTPYDLHLADLMLRYPFKAGK